MGKWSSSHIRCRVEIFGNARVVLIHLVFAGLCRCIHLDTGYYIKRTWKVEAHLNIAIRTLSNKTFAMMTNRIANTKTIAPYVSLSKAKTRTHFSAQKLTRLWCKTGHTAQLRLVVIRLIDLSEYLPKTPVRNISEKLPSPKVASITTDSRVQKCSVLIIVPGDLRCGS